jgi:DNA mismatch repair protein MutS
VREQGDSIMFLRKIAPGVADKSYGIHVARLAGIPKSVIRRSGEILAHLESADTDKDRVALAPKMAATKRRTRRLDDDRQLKLF